MAAQCTAHCAALAVRSPHTSIFFDITIRCYATLPLGLILRLALVSSLDDENEDRVVERPDDGGGGVDSELAVISLTFIEVDVDESTEVTDADEVMEVFATLDVAMIAAVAATLRADRIFDCLLIIFLPSRKASFSSVIRRTSSSLWRELGLLTLFLNAW